MQGLHHFADGEFAVALPDWGDNPDLAQMRQQFNLTAEHLRKQRFSSQQREIMLQTLLEQINSALILIDAQGKIVIGNPAACEIFTTLGERTEHLAGFLSAYAQIARLPKLILKPQDWRVWLNSLKHLCALQLTGPPPERQGLFDSAQLSQVFINLVKNSLEAGSPQQAITLSSQNLPQWDLLRLEDKGSGMAPNVLAQALLTFYSTKRNGTGLGPALCREIIEAHDGRLYLQNHTSKGLRVDIWLPSVKPVPAR